MQQTNFIEENRDGSRQLIEDLEMKPAVNLDELWLVSRASRHDDQGGNSWCGLGNFLHA